MSTPDDQPTPLKLEKNATTKGKVIRADQLFGQEREICIEHAGERYRLRITRRNKLILQK